VINRAGVEDKPASEPDMIAEYAALVHCQHLLVMWTAGDLDARGGSSPDLNGIVTVIHVELGTERQQLLR
jgi:hypothetical protein